MVDFAIVPYTGELKEPSSPNYTSGADILSGIYYKSRIWLRGKWHFDQRNVNTWFEYNAYYLH